MSMAMAPPNTGSFTLQDNVPHHVSKTAQEWLEKHNKEAKLLICPLNSPDPNQASAECTRTSQIHRSPTCTPQDTTIDPVSRLRWVRAVVVAWGGPTQYWAGGFNVVAHQCINKVWLDFSVFLQVAVHWALSTAVDVTGRTLNTQIFRSYVCSNLNFVFFTAACKSVLKYLKIPFI